MRHQALLANALHQADLTNQQGCVICRPVFVNLPPNNLAVVDVHYQVQSIEDSTDGRRQKGDVPAPDLIGACGLVTFGFVYLSWCLRFPSMLQLIGFLQYPVKTEFGSDIDSFIGQCRYDPCGGRLWHSSSLQVSRICCRSSGFSLFAGVGRSASGRPSALTPPPSVQCL